MPELAPGSIFAGYRIEDVAGRGGMGVVYRARHLGLKRQVALKLIAPELAEQSKFAERFKRESMAAIAIEHPNVIPVYDAGEVDEQLFISMRYVEGTTLLKVIDAEGRLEPARAVRIVGQVAAALDAAHREGLVHRDVKPANVLLTADEEHVYLTDFGLTKHAASVGALTEPGKVPGTPDYMAPEQVRGGPLDARTDVYALGAVLFHAVTGRVPYPREGALPTMYAQMQDPPPTITDVVSDVPPALDDVIKRSMAKEPDGRYPSAGDLGGAARAALTHTRPDVPERSVAAGTARVGRAPDEAAPVAPAAGSNLPPATPPADPPAPAPPRIDSAAEQVAPKRAGEAPGLASSRGSTGGAAAATLDDAPGGAGGDTGSAAEAPRAGARVRWRLLAVPLVAVAVAVVVLWPRDEEISLTQVGVSPRSLAPGLGGDAVWVADPTQPEAWWLDAEASTHQVPLSVEEGEGLTTARPLGVAVDQDRRAVWVVDGRNDRAWRIDVESKEVVTPVPVGDRPQSVAVAKNAAWVANLDGSVSQINTITNEEVIPRIQLGGTPTSVAVGNGAVWVVDTAHNKVWRIDPRRRTPFRRTDYPSRRPAAVATGPDAVWVANLDGTLSRIDPGTNQVTETLDVGGAPCGVAVGEGAVWVTDNARDMVLKIDPERGATVADRFEVEDGPCAIAAGNDAVWVANRGDSSLSRITP